jgi:2-polyprenyl-3-methyl-5-hydroxy-6-metoxy-1,4-benzoquinol methylase
MMLDFLLNRRRVVGEIMDSPGLEESAHRQALAGLRRINRVSRTALHMVRPILEMAQREGLKRLSLLDVACGGGDVPIEMARLGAAAGVRIELTLMDRSETAVRTAMQAAKAAGIAGRGIVGDVLSSSSILDSAGVDVVTNSLFLHHLSSAEQVSGMLGRLNQMAGRLVVISDLRRSRAGWAVAWMGCRMLSRSPIVHYDGPASVRAAWTMGELRQFTGQAGIAEARIERCPPVRMLITWRTS